MTKFPCSHTCNLISCWTFYCAVLNAELAARNTKAKSIAFSLVSEAAANQLLEDLGLIEVDGFKEAPFETATG